MWLNIGMAYKNNGEYTIFIKSLTLYDNLKQKILITFLNYNVIKKN